MTITSVPNLDAVDQNLSTSQSKRSEALDVASHDGHEISFRNYGKIWIDSVHIYNMQAKMLSGVNVLLRRQSAFLPNHPPATATHTLRAPCTHGRDPCDHAGPSCASARTNATPTTVGKAAVCAAVTGRFRAPAHARMWPLPWWARRQSTPQLWRSRFVHLRTHGRRPCGKAAARAQRPVAAAHALCAPVHAQTQAPRL
jgi:hypothetical protein